MNAVSHPNLPPLSDELAKRIRLVRRDIGSLLFHFTRKPEEPFVTTSAPNGAIRSWPASASAILNKILYESKLIGGVAKYTNGERCVCFTEMPIQEMSAVFSLNAIAAQADQRPRYEPYGVAVSKEWLFREGGRPVIYDHPDAITRLPEADKYRFVPYDPAAKIDFTWEREWRIKTDCLNLDPTATLVIVPFSDEAFQIVYDFAELETDWDESGPIGAFHSPRWLAVSLDLLGC